MKTIFKKTLVIAITSVVALSGSALSAFAAPPKTVDVFTGFSFDESCYNEASDIIKANDNPDWNVNIVDSSNVALTKEAVSAWWGHDASYCNGNEAVIKALAAENESEGGYAVFKVTAERGVFSVLKLIVNARYNYDFFPTLSVCDTQSGEYTDIFSPTDYNQELNTGNAGHDTLVDVTETAKGKNEVFVKATFPQCNVPSYCALYYLGAKYKTDDSAPASSTESTVSASSNTESTQSNASDTVVSSDTSSANGSDNTIFYIIIAAVAIAAIVSAAVIVIKKKKN